MHASMHVSMYNHTQMHTLTHAFMHTRTPVYNMIWSAGLITIPKQKLACADKIKIMKTISKTTVSLSENLKSIAKEPDYGMSSTMTESINTCA